MAKITYLLGAGASYNACPILEKQAEMMIAVANEEIRNSTNKSDGYGGATSEVYEYLNHEIEKVTDENKIQVLWYIGYFGKKAIEYNTIDTYARKLFLNDELDELNLLKMSVSVFFDLWENFYETRYRHFSNEEYSLLENKNIQSKNIAYKKIDDRYKSLFSVLLDKSKNGKIELNKDFKFITWNYDLQLETTFKTFLKDGNNFDNTTLDELFKFKESKNDNLVNDIFHLNGHRGFYNIKDGIAENRFNGFDEYWKNNEYLYRAVINKDTDFNNYIKYAWEHNLDDTHFKKIANVINQTQVLVIIGYSFPAFNRFIDQFLFLQLNPDKIKKIIYQDPNGNEQLIKNLFEFPQVINGKLQVLNDAKSLRQFYLPNEFFISQKTGKKVGDIR